MNVLLVVPSLDVEKFKGLARVSLELKSGLEKRGIDVETFEVHKEKKNYLKNLTTTPLKELRSKVDIIHATTPESASFLWLIRLFKNVKSIVTFHDLIPLKYCEELDFKFKSLVKIYTTLMWKFATKTDVLVAVSSRTAEDVRMFFGRKADYIINPGISEKFREIRKHDLSTDKITLGFFANFSYRKGLDKAIEVFKIVRKKIDCRLVIAGGELQTVYQKQFDVRKLTKGLKDVEIRGYIPEDEIVDIYNSLDFYLFPSSVEGFGIPILEAQKCGVPTLVFEWADIPEEAKAKAVVCKDVNDMADKILHLVENKEAYRAISEAGKQYAKKFTWDKFVEKHIEIYESLMRR